jgi:N-formylglutamate amidohydrolase
MNAVRLHRSNAAITSPVVLDSPHSGHDFPADFDAAVSEWDLREPEDMYVDELYAPATELGVPLLAATFPRAYLDANRHRGDIDFDLIDGPWPHEVVPSGKARLGQALVWRLLADGTPIYARRLAVAQVQARIESCHAPYHRALTRLLDETHARHGVVYHLNCHSMSAVGDEQSEGGKGVPRAAFVLGDRDGTSCDPAFTDFVAGVLRGFGYDVKLNDPYKGVELVKAYSNPAAGRHSLQVEINKRLYMNECTREKIGRFASLQAHLTELVRAVIGFARTPAR